MITTRALVRALAFSSVAMTGCGAGTDRVVVTMSHGPVTNSTYVDAEPEGPSAGDTRSTRIEGTDGNDRSMHLDAVLTTTSVDAGGEQRLVSLVFTWDDTGSQVVVQGSASYPTGDAVLDKDTVVERAITGGTGEFAGASGTVISTHLADDTWTHELRIDH